jgi:hypothetical protein
VSVVKRCDVSLMVSTPPSVPNNRVGRRVTITVRRSYVLSSTQPADVASRHVAIVACEEQRGVRRMLFERHGLVQM